MLEHDRAVKKLVEPLQQIIGKKRKYSEAIGKDNDYEVVQDPDIHINNRGDYWADAYIEQNKK
jgi:restriction endonuclease S subunit